MLHPAPLAALQGDKEKAAGMPISFLMDRDKTGCVFPFMYLFFVFAVTNGVCWWQSRR
jgi:hypothetical protein